MAIANQLYEGGELSDAAAQYQTLVDAGVQEGFLYYNLGNTYFKLGDLGRAILNFRRAERLLPRDGDVAANLSLARAQTLDRIEDEDKGAITRWVRRLIGWTTLNEAATAALALWTILCGLGIAFTVVQRKRQVWILLASGTATLLILGILSIGIRLLDEHNKPPAVIVATETVVRSGPGDGYLAEFTLHSGAEVRIIERREDWTRIALPGDLQGWTLRNDVVEIAPRD
jgi:tetratricopeptide (TPR) repeat protein